jgi:hypothetical protein
VLRSLAPILGPILLAVGAAGSWISATGDRDAYRVADINHAIHIARDLECVDCHVGVETHAAAGVPGIAICAECHDDPEDSIRRTENGKRILDHISRNEQLWWPQLYWLPDHVVFSHRRHVSLGGIACETCHGGIASTTTLPEEPVETTLTMDGCMDCHARSGADLDCYACHK